MTYTEFKKLKINTSPIGWEPPSKDETAYFCTPKGARTSVVPEWTASITVPSVRWVKPSSQSAP